MRSGALRAGGVGALAEAEKNLETSRIAGEEAGASSCGTFGETASATALRAVSARGAFTRGLLFATDFTGSGALGLETEIFLALIALAGLVLAELILGIADFLGAADLGFAGWVDLDSAGFGSVTFAAAFTRGRGLFFKTTRTAGSAAIFFLTAFFFDFITVLSRNFSGGRAGERLRADVRGRNGKPASECRAWLGALR